MHLPQGKKNIYRFKKDILKKITIILTPNEQYSEYHFFNNKNTMLFLFLISKSFFDTITDQENMILNQ